MADPYKDKVVLFLPMEGSRNGDTVILDKTGKTITRNGDTILSTAVVPPFGKTSAYFDGTGDYITGPSSDDFLFGTKDFTIECWVNISNFSSDRAIIGYSWHYGTYSATWLLFIKSTTGYINISIATGSATAIDHTTSTGIIASTWNHIAVTRDSGIIRIFLNGTAIYNASESTNINATWGSYPYIFLGGSPNGGSYPFIGYMKDIRITKGVARYTGNFNVSNTITLSDEHWPKVVLHITGEESGSTFTDISNVGQTITGNGGIAHSSSSSPPFGTNAIEFTAANSQYLSFTGTSNFDFGTAPFTIEMWIKNKNDQDSCALYSDIYPSTIRFTIAFAAGSMGAGSYLTIGFYSGSWTYFVSTYKPRINKWEHIAVARQEDKIRLYVNGIFLGSLTTSTAIGYDAENYYIGRRWDNGLGTFFYNGYIKDIRITKGIARYYHESGYETHTKLIGEHEDKNYNKLVLALSGTEVANETIYPYSFTNWNGVTANNTVGSPYSATGNALKFVRSSNQFLVYGANPSSYDFKTNDFTLETWVYLTSTPANWFCVYQNGPNYNVCGFALHYGSSGLIIQMSSNGSSNDIYDGYPGIPVNINQWDHIALVRSGSNIYIYHNGTRYSVTTTTKAIYYNSTYYPQIGGRLPSSSFAFDGYMAGYRIYNGIAKYTAATELIDRKLYNYSVGAQKRSPNKTDIKTIVKPFDWDEPTQPRIVI